MVGGRKLETAGLGNKSHQPDITNIEQSDSDGENDSTAAVSQEPTLQEPPQDFTSTTRRVHDPLRARKKPQVVFVCDSIPKYVNKDQFFGNKAAAIRRLGTAKDGHHSINTWSTSREVEVFIIHLGINNVQNTHDEQSLFDNLQGCMDAAARKCPNATVVFSEILVPRQNQYNDSTIITNVNKRMRDFCSTRPLCLYVQHSLLQRSTDCYDDTVHINSGKGTKIFVADITRTVRQTSQRESERKYQNPQRYNTPRESKMSTWRAMRQVGREYRQENHTWPNGGLYPRSTRQEVDAYREGHQRHGGNENQRQPDRSSGGDIIYRLKQILQEY